MFRSQVGKKHHGGKKKEKKNSPSCPQGLPGPQGAIGTPGEKVRVCQIHSKTHTFVFLFANKQEVGEIQKNPASLMKFKLAHEP